MRIRMRWWRVLFFLTFLFACQIQAAPYDGKQDTLQQPDGTSVDVRIWGDEYFQHIESLAGRTLVRDADTGEICYAELSDDGSELLSTGQRYDGNELITSAADDLSQRGFSNPVRLNMDTIRKIADENKALLEAEALPESSGDIALQNEDIQPATTIYGPTNRLSGNYQGLVLLIDFSDQVATISQSSIDNFCNQEGYTGYGNNGSVRDYYYDASNGKMVYTNYVTAYYRAANPKSYYEDTSVSYGTRARELIREALNNLEYNVGFDFTTLSLSGGKIRALNAMYAGNASSGWSKGLWPHKSSGINFTADGVTADIYQITDIEYSLSIGTFCHENGHMLCGYPDLYDYGGESRGVGSYCLMASSGSTNPIMICPYLRYTNGWMNFIDITNDYGVVSHPLTANSDTCYYYLNPDYNSEYFIFEARRKTGRSSNLPDEGLAIWHIDRNGSNNNEQMTADSHYKVSLEQADGLFDLENDRDGGDGNDLFHSGYRYQFDDYTTPNANWWSGENSGLVVQYVSAVGNTMSFETNNNAIQVSFVSPTEGTPIILGEAITVNVSATDETSTITAVELYLDETLVSVDTSSPYQWGTNVASLQNLNAGNHSLKAIATNSKGESKMATMTLEILAPTVLDLSTTSYNYDLGPRDSNVMSGWTLLSPEMYGDINWSIAVNALDRGAISGINDINRDIIYSTKSATLSHKVRDGLWAVTINLGDAKYARDNMVVGAEGQIFHTDVDSDIAEFSYANFNVEVSDGELNITVSDNGGSDAYWTWTRLSLSWLGNNTSSDFDDFAKLASSWMEKNPYNGKVLYESFNTSSGVLSGQNGWSDFLSSPSVTTTEIYDGGGNALHSTDTNNDYRVATRVLTESVDVTATEYYLSATFVKTTETNNDDDSIVFGLSGVDNNKPKIEFRIRPHNGSIVATGNGSYFYSTTPFVTEVGKPYRAIIKISPISGSTTNVLIEGDVIEIVDGQIGGRLDYTLQTLVGSFALNSGQKTYSNVICGVRSNEVKADDFLLSTAWLAMRTAVAGDLDGIWAGAASDSNDDAVVNLTDLIDIAERWIQ